MPSPENSQGRSWAGGLEMPLTLEGRRSYTDTDTQRNAQTLSLALSPARAWIGWIVCTTEFVCPRPLLEKLELDDPNGKSKRPSVNVDVAIAVWRRLSLHQSRGIRNDLSRERRSHAAVETQPSAGEAVPGMDDLLGFEELREASNPCLLRCVTDHRPVAPSLCL